MKTSQWKEIEKRFDDMFMSQDFRSKTVCYAVQDFIRHEIDEAVETALLKQHLKEMSI